MLMKMMIVLLSINYEGEEVMVIGDGVAWLSGRQQEEGEERRLLGRKSQRRWREEKKK